MWTKARPTVIRLFFLLLSCTAWQGAARWVVAIPGPIEVIRDVVLLLRNGIILDILLSAWRVLVALVISFIAGISLGSVSARVPLLNLLLGATLVPLIEALPPLTWTIICILVIGVGEASVFFVVCMILTQFFVVSAIEGFKNIDGNLVEMATSFPLGRGLTSDTTSFSSRMNILRHVEFGMMTPYLITATRLAYGVAWKVIVVAEMFGASEGIGYLINQAYSTLSITRLMSLSTLIVLFFFLGDRLVLQTAGRSLRKWQASS